MISYNSIVNHEDNTAVLKMGKEALGGQDAMAFANAIKNLPNNVNRLVLDMSSLEVINSTGLGMIAKANNDLKVRNIDLIISGANSTVSRLFEITNLNKVFTIID